MSQPPPIEKRISDLLNLIAEPPRSEWLEPKP